MQYNKTQCGCHFLFNFPPPIIPFFADRKKMVSFSRIFYRTEPKKSNFLIKIKKLPPIFFVNPFVIQKIFQFFITFFLLPPTPCIFFIASNKNTFLMAVLIIEKKATLFLQKTPQDQLYRNILFLPYGFFDDQVGFFIVTYTIILYHIVFFIQQDCKKMTKTVKIYKDAFFRRTTEYTKTTEHNEYNPNTALKNIDSTEKSFFYRSVYSRSHGKKNPAFELWGSFFTL